MSESIHTWSNGALRIRVFHDLGPLNPRTENDNITHLACDHGRYNLGDKYATDDLRTVIENLAKNLGINIEDEYVTCSECGDWRTDPLPDDNTRVEITTIENPFAVALKGAARLIRPETVKRWRKTDEDCACDDDNQIENPYFISTESLADCMMALATVDPDEEHIFLRELFLYDHGGITISTGSYSCPWDSNKVGIGFMTREETTKHLGSMTDLSTEQLREAAHKAIDTDVAEYATYLEGRVYGFQCERLLPRPRAWDPEEWAEHYCHWEEEESCWGFFGDYDEPEKSGMFDHWPEEYRAMYKAQA